MKKTILLNGKTYVLKDEEVEKTKVKAAEEEADDTSTDEEETDVEETEDESTDEEVEAGLDEAADGAAQKILATLGIDKLQKTIETINTKLESETDESKGKKALLNLENLMNKKVSEMTSKEKIVGFFQAMIRNDTTALKALSEGTAADGGYLFPDEFRAEIIRDMADQPRMRNLVTVIPMKRDVMNLPSLVSGPQVTWTDENASKSTTTAHFGQVTLTAYKMAAIMYLSDELIEDSDQVDIVKMIIGLFSEAIGNEEDKVITAGSGSSQPTGLATATIGSVACSGNLDFDDIINLEYLLPAKYHPNAKYLVHRNNIREMRKIKDNNGRYLWQDAVAPGQPGTFHGYPVIENNWLAESEIYFGDYKKAYYFGDRKSMAVKISNDTETAFTKDQTAVRVVSRIGGTVALPAAVRKLTTIP